VKVQGQRSQKENVQFSAESERLKMEKPDPATWSKIRPELETAKKQHQPQKWSVRPEVRV